MLGTVLKLSTAGHRKDETACMTKKKVHVWRVHSAGLAQA